MGEKLIALIEEKGDLPPLSEILVNLKKKSTIQNETSWKSPASLNLNPFYPVDWSNLQTVSCLGVDGTMPKTCGCEDGSGYGLHRETPRSLQQTKKLQSTPFLDPLAGCRLSHTLAGVHGQNTSRRNRILLPLRFDARCWNSRFWPPDSRKI